MKPTGINKLMQKLALATAFAIGALLGSGAAVAGIANTKHNLGSGGAAGQNKVSDTDEICVFCHTPHGADVSNPAPLWNKRLTTGATYTTYASINSTTMNAQFASDGLAGSPSIGSVSLACLSCHDGTQAMDNIINAPGSGGLTADGGATNGLAYNWGTSPRIDGGGFGLLTGIANLGNDLSNDHPIGIQYCGGGPTTAAPGAACNDSDFVTPTNATIGGGTAFWVETGGAGRQKTDMILYNRTFAAGAGPSVECASCHDPHSENATFLRIANAGSAVCLACHVK